MSTKKQTLNTLGAEDIVYSWDLKYGVVPERVTACYCVTDMVIVQMCNLIGSINNSELMLNFFYELRPDKCTETQRNRLNTEGVQKFYLDKSEAIKDFEQAKKVEIERLKNLK